VRILCQRLTATIHSLYEHSVTVVHYLSSQSASHSSYGVGVTGASVGVTGASVDVTGANVGVTGANVGVTGANVDVTGANVDVTLESGADAGRGNSAGKAVGSNLVETLTVDDDDDEMTDDDGARLTAFTLHTHRISSHFSTKTYFKITITSAVREKSQNT